jgi:hypothetical protein
LPDWLIGLISGLAPPFLISWLVSYVPKLFRREYLLSRVVHLQYWSWC